MKEKIVALAIGSFSYLALSNHGALANVSCEDAVVDAGIVLLESVGFSDTNADSSDLTIKALSKKFKTNSPSFLSSISKKFAGEKASKRLYSHASGTFAFFLSTSDEPNIAPSLFTVSDSGSELLIDPFSVIALSIVAQNGAAVAGTSPSDLLTAIFPRSQLVLSKNAFLYKTETAVITSLIDQNKIQLEVSGADGSNIATQNVELKNECVSPQTRKKD